MNIYKFSYYKLLLTCLFFISICISPILGQTSSITREIDAWYSRDRNASIYKDIRQNLIDICRRAESAQLPPELLFAKFREGAAKRINANRVMNALEEELLRLQSIQALINHVDQSYEQTYSQVYFFFPGENEQERLSELVELPNISVNKIEIIQQFSILVRSGLTIDLMQRVFLYAANRQQAYPYVLYLFKSIIDIPAFTRLDAENLFTLCRAVLASQLPASTYPVITSLFIKGNRYNLSYPVIARTIIEELDQGGGLIQVEQALKRMGR